jgi:NADPH:quinone reductase-like Zn-dependent oxidoreductase
MRFGTYAEYVCVPEDALIVEKAGHLTFEEAAVLSVGGLEALHFNKRAEIQKGNRVLINGAGGRSARYHPKVHSPGIPNVLRSGRPYP